MTTAEFQHLIETRRISLEWALDWRASIAQPYTFAWGQTAAQAVERLATKAGWTETEPLPLFEEATDGQRSPATIRTGDQAHYSSTEDGGEVTTETLVATVLSYDSRLTPEQARDLVKKFRELYREARKEKP